MISAGFIVGVVLIVTALSCFFYVWRRTVERTRELDRWGKDLGVGRWEDEPNEHYQERIYNRIDITGGKRNPW